MLFGDQLIIVRGGGDLGTGVVSRLHRAGFPVVVLEIAEPLAIRRAVSFASAVDEGAITVEGTEAKLTDSVADALESARPGTVAVMVSPELPPELRGLAVVDARLAKRNIDTGIEQAPLVVGLGPGFTAGHDCHAVVETARGPHLGRVLWEGPALADTGVPGVVGGESSRRVIRATTAGRVRWSAQIGDIVEAGQLLGHIEDEPVTSAIGGVVRGLIAEGRAVSTALKIADIDPRAEVAACFEISDKALAVGGGVLEAILTHLNQTS